MVRWQQNVLSRSTKIWLKDSWNMQGTLHICHVQSEPWQAKKVSFSVEPKVTVSSSLVSCCGELVSINSSLSWFSIPASGSVDIVCATFGKSLFLHFLIQSNCICGAMFFTRIYIWRYCRFFRFSWLLRPRTRDDPSCPLLVWMNVKWIVTFSLLQWELLKQFNFYSWWKQIVLIW